MIETAICLLSVAVIILLWTGPILMRRIISCERMINLQHNLLLTVGETGLANTNAILELREKLNGSRP